MQYLLTGKQMQKADAYTIQQIGIPSLVLMERAALGVVDYIEQKAIQKDRILVICGAGNNGGDGYAIARLLHIKGYAVEICFTGKETSRSEENQLQRNIADYYQIPIVSGESLDAYTVIVDALFGTGLTREITGEYRALLERCNQAKAYRVAVDTPSGIDSENGNILGCAFRADLTVAIAFHKRGLRLQPGNQYAGEIVIADIGIYEDAISKEETLCYELEWHDFQTKFPKRIGNSHKGSYGKVLMVTGSKGMSGAAYLSAKAAYMVGAGLVQIYTHEENRVILQQLLPEAIITTYERYDAEQLQKQLDGADVVAVGCGLSTDDVAESIVSHIMKYNQKPCVLDADGINLLAKHKEWLAERNFPMIITPHMKEMARFMECEVKDLQKERIDYLQKAVKAYDITCVLKDARTVIASDEKRICINTTGNAAMAKGGSGDVLTGVIAGIMAQGVSCQDAAPLGAYLHGMAGDAAKNKKGCYSVLASDIVTSISDILKEI